MPSCSRLYSLPPIAVGTPDVQSMTNYLVCLAAAHVVSVRYLLSDEVYRDEKGAPLASWSNWMTLASTANGAGAEAVRIAGILREKTCRADLLPLALIDLRKIVGGRPLKKQREWCPDCLNELRDSGQQVYEKLTWTLQVTRVCLIHNRRLERLCPHCFTIQRILAANLSSGCCYRCGGWLGCAHPFASPSVSTEDLWIANAVGQLLSAQPHINVEHFATNYRQAVIERANLVAGGSIRALSRTGFDFKRVLAQFRDDRTVPLGSLLRSIFLLGTSVADLLHGTPAAIHTDRSEQYVMPHYPQVELRRRMQQEIDSSTPRTPKILAEQLGYAGTVQLWRADRNLFAQLKRKASVTGRESWTNGDLEDARKSAHAALEESLALDFPNSVKHVAKQLAAVTEGTIRKWFPDFCEAIASKRDRYIDAVCEAEMSRALQEAPTPTLSEVSRRSGQSLAVLMQRTPAKCRQLAKRRSEELECQTAHLELQVDRMLLEVPPPSPQQASARLNVTWSSLRHRIPRLCQKLKEKSRSYKAALRMKANEEIAERIRVSVNEIRASGHYPSAARTASALPDKPAWKFFNDVRRSVLGNENTHGVFSRRKPVQSANVKEPADHVSRF